MLQNLSRLFAFTLIAAFFLAVFEVRFEIVLACLAVGAVGLVTTEVLIARQRAVRYFHAVERHARQVGLPFDAQERLRAEKQQTAWIVVVFLVLGIGVVLTILTNNPLFVFGAFILAFAAFAVLGLRQKQKQTWVWRDFAEQQGLTYKPLRGDEGPGVQGLYQGRTVVLQTMTRRSYSRTSSRYTLSGSTRRTAYTQGLVTVENPRDLSFLMRETKIKRSRPSDFARRLVQDTDLGRRLADISPTEVELRGQQLRIERRGELNDAAEVRFLLDLLCEAATLIEVYGAWGQGA